MELGVLRPGDVAELGEDALAFNLHQLLVTIVIDERYDPRDRALPVDEPPREAADRHTLVQEEVDVPAEALGVDDPLVEELDVT